MPLVIKSVYIDWAIVGFVYYEIHVELAPYFLKLCFDELKRVHTVMASLDTETPKLHMLFHMMLRSREQGNPWFYHNFYDEALNSVLKRAARYCHQRTFEYSLLHKMMYVLAHARGLKRARD